MARSARKLLTNEERTLRKNERERTMNAAKSSAVSALHDLNLAPPNTGAELQALWACAEQLRSLLTTVTTDRQREVLFSQFPAAKDAKVEQPSLFNHHRLIKSAM